MERKDWNYKTYLGDCIDGMRLLPAGSVDFLFTDLPYGRTNCKWDTPIDLEAFWSEADRVVKKDGAVALFAQTPFDKVLGCSNLRNLRYEWIWEKSNATGHLNAKKMPTHYIDTQNRTEIYQKATKEVKGGGNTDRYPRSVIKGPSDKQTSHLHPTQKPVWLCERLVLTYTNPGEVVLDCCAGSASIGVACCRTGRRYIGIENEKQYYDVMRTRLRECCRSHSKEVG